MNLLKQPIYRNPALLKLAKDAPICFWCDSPNDGTVVSCHSNSQSDGKGMGRKASDAAIFAGCAKCHRDYDSGMQSRLWKQAKFNEAHMKTMRWLIESGNLVVKVER